MKLLITFILVVVSIRVDDVTAGRILYLSSPQFSHLHVVTCMKDELKEYGHELWIACPEYLLHHQSFKDINLIKLNSLGSTNIDETFFSDVAKLKLDPESLPPDTNLLNRLFDKINRHILPGSPTVAMRQRIMDIHRKILGDETLIQEIKERRFDLIVVDGGLGIALSIIPYKLDIPFCYISIMLFPWQSGTPTFPSFVPLAAMGTTDRMPFLQRLQNMILHILFANLHPLVSNSDVSTFAPEKPYTSINALSSKSLMWFVTQNIVFDFPRPIMPNTKLVGGLCAKGPKPLLSKFKDFCDLSEQGVVVVSFGGSLKTLPPKVSDKLRIAFSKTKYKYIWRSDLTSNTSQILMTDWLPQNDLLAHPNVKLFITHGGVNGVYEALYHGVPMLVLPVFAEQPRNAEKVKTKGFGLFLDIIDSTADEFTNAINEIIEKPFFKDNIKEASTIFRNQPVSPRQEAAFWMDYLIKHGDTYIRSAGLDLPWYQFLCLDVILFLLLISAVSLTVFLLTIRCCWRCICRSKGRKHKSD